MPFRLAVAGEAPPPAAAQPTALIELDGTGSENLDGGDLEYLWTQIDGPRVELSDPTDPKPYFRTGKPGLYRFQLVVTANGLSSDPFIVEIMIERDNLAPVAKAPAEVRGEVDKPLEIDGGESFDPEGEQLTYRWRVLSGGLHIPPAALDKPVLSFTPGLDGVFELELVVSDGRDPSPPHIIRVYVKPPPRPPVARARAVAKEIPSLPQADMAMAPAAGARPVAAIAGPSVAKRGEKVMLDARGSRGSGTVRLDYLWRQKSGPFVSDFELVFDGAAERFTPPRTGDYEFELVVSDGMRESEPAIHHLKVVSQPDPPVAVVVAPERAMPGALVTLDATQSYDLEGSKLTYHWRQTGGPQVTRYLIDDNLGNAAPSFHPPTAGVYSFELVVANGDLRSRPVEIDIEVGSAKRPPQLAIAGPQVVNTGEALVLKADMGESPARGVSFVWRQVEGPVKMINRIDGADLTLTMSMPGRYVFDLSALDGGGIAATARQAVEVFGPPVPGAHHASPQQYADTMVAPVPAMPMPAPAARPARNPLAPLPDLPMPEPPPEAPQLAPPVGLFRAPRTRLPWAERPGGRPRRSTPIPWGPIRSSGCPGIRSPRFPAPRAYKGLPEVVDMPPTSARRGAPGIGVPQSGVASVSRPTGLFSCESASAGGTINKAVAKAPTDAEDPGDGRIQGIRRPRYLSGPDQRDAV